VPVGPPGPAGARAVLIRGASGVPAGATAVVLNVTGIGPTSNTSVTVSPHGVPRPATSNLNLLARQSATPNLVVVKVGANGQVDFFNAAGSLNLVADLAGYYTPTGGSSFNPVTPCRLFDTRHGTSTCVNASPVPAAPIGAAGVLSVPIAGQSGVPADATAVVLNVTGVTPTSGTFVTVFPYGVTRPTSSNLNLPAGSTARSNLVVVQLDGTGAIDFFNSAGSVQLIADLAGYYSASTGSAYHPMTPCRAFDTRSGLGSCVGAVRNSPTPIGAGQTRSVQLAGPNTIPESATAVVLNVTAVAPSTNGFVTVYPDGVTLPGVSNLNTAAGAGPTPNLVVVPIGATTKRVNFFNGAGSVHLVVDVAGYFG
jgi:hypothetical protein